MLNSGSSIDFYSVDYLRYEIANHYDKLTKISNQTFDQIVKTEYFIVRGIKSISEEQISEINCRSAHNLVLDVDLDDIAFVALAKHIECKLWTSDGILIRGLSKNGFKNTILTDELLEYRNTLENRSRKFK